MKKRVLSLLLVLCMLLTAMPVFTFGSGAADGDNDLTKNENSKAVSSFYDYYVTDGLVAFYDAYDTASDVLDLEGGKWYAKIYNATTGAFEKTTDEAFIATIGGGVLGAEIPPAEEGGDPTVNETGWVKGDKMGFSYFTNKNVGANKISLPLSLIAYDAYTVEFVGRVDLRKIHDAEQESGIVDKITADGMTTYTISGLTTLVRNTSTYYTNLCYYTVTLKGEANAKVDFKVNDADVTVTLDAQGNGTYMAKCDAKLDTYVIVAPEAVELTFSKDKALNSQYMSNAAFVFGTLHCTHWTNAWGDNAWGNGAGKSRWYTGSADWGTHNGNAGDTRYGGSYKDASFFVTYDGIDTLMRVEKSKSTGESYTVTYGGSSTSVAGNKPFDNYKFDLLSNTCGAAYAVRVYNRALTKQEKAYNTFADKMIYNGVDFDAFNALSDSLKEMYIKSTEALELEAGVEAYTEALAGVVDFAEKEAAMRKMSDYDKLYVGADGEKTANGGSLVALFSAYGSNTASVDFQNKSWRAKVGNVDAVLMGDVYDSATKKGYWQLRPEGGIGYDIGLVGDGFGAAKYTDQTTSGGAAYMQGTVDATYTGAANTYIQLDPSLISTPDFTVEYIVRYPYLKVVENGEFVGEVTTNIHLGDSISNKPTDTIGLLKNYVPRTGSIDAASTAPRVIRWYVAKPADGWAQSGFNSQLWSETSRVNDDVFMQTITRDETALEIGGAEATYQILKDTSVSKSGKYSTSNSTKGTLYFVGASAAGQSFRLFQQVSVTAYSLRVYDAVLTVAEMQQNRIIDLAAYCGADLTAYKALTPEAREVANSMLSGNQFTTDQAEFEAALKTITDILGGEMDLAESLYVTDGLTVLLTAYAGFNTGSIGGGDAPINWFNGIKQGTFAALRGKGWTLGENGGFSITKTWDEFNKDTTFGLYIDQQFLPTADYTVELVANPVGITNVDGSRFIDDFSTYGQNYNNGFAIGPLRCLQFVCYRPTGKDGQLEKRWVYQKEANAWAASGFKSRWTDTSWKSIGLDQILTYTISLDVGDDNSSQYIFRSDSKQIGSIKINANDYLAPSDTDGMFQLMVGVAGTIYACRVYNRTLTDAEVKQNHMADLVYFYGLDTTFLDSTLASMDDASALYNAFADMDFTLEREEAQAYFESKTAAIWMHYTGFSIRGDMTDGIRYYFDTNQSGIDAMLAAGFGLEIGAIVNIDKDAAPVLDNYGYDYKVIAFDNVAGKYNGFYIDEDTFAVTVRYQNANKAALLSSIGVRGYVKLTSPDGAEMIFYGEVDAGTPVNHFEAYHVQNEAKIPVIEDDMGFKDYLGERIGGCYDDLYVYVDANAAAGGDGTAEAPFNGFNDGWLKAKELMLGLNKPTYLYLQAADGVYGLYGTLTLTAEEKPYAYCNFIITSESGNSVLTTNIDLDSGDFEYEGDNIYTYQFDKNADGKYPEFRYLYVNDRQASLSASSATRARDVDNVYKTVAEREFDAVYYNAKLMYENGTIELDSMPEAYVGREDLSSVFADYAARFTALKDIMSFKLNEIDESTMPPQGTANATYATLFEDFKYGRIAHKDLKAVVDANGVSSDAFKNFLAEQGSCPDNDLYRKWFATIKAHMAEEKTTGFTFTIDQLTDSKTIGKVYLNLEMVGDLSHMIEEGKVRMNAYAAALQIEIDQMLADAKAAYEAALLAQRLAEATYTVFAGATTDKYITDSIPTQITSTEADVAAKTQALTDALTAYLAAEEAYTAALAAYEAALAAYEADPENADLALDLDLKQADMETKKAELDTADQAGAVAANDLVIAENRLNALNEVADLFEDGGLEAVKAETQNKLLARLAAENVTASASAAQSKATSEHATKQAYIDEVTHEDLWVRHALTQYMIEMHVTAQWDYNIIHVTGIDYADTYDVVYDGKQTSNVAVYLEMSQYKGFVIPANYTFRGRFVFLKNILEYVDGENEFFYDEEIGKLYYYTENDINSLKFSYPTSDYMFKFYNLENVSIENLNFTGVDDNFLSDNGHLGGQSGSDSRFGGFPDRSAIYIDGCYGMTIYGCNFYDLGVHAIRCQNWIEDLTIDSNTFENIGSSAIRLGNSTAEWAPGVAGNLRVSVINNYCNNIATEYHQASAVQIQSNKDCVFQNNTLRNTSYTGFSLGWRWSTVTWQRGEDINQDNLDVSANYIYDFMTEMADGGAIYMLGGNAAIEDTSYFNFLHHNYIVFTNISGDGSGGMICGIYFDGSCTNWHCYSNVVVEQSYGAHTSETQDRGQSETYVNQLRKRRNGSTFIYIQHIPSQLTYNILVENNIVINVRNTDDDQMLKEVYKTYVVASRNIKESGTRYVHDIDRIPSMAEDIMYAAGAYDYAGDPSMLYGNDY